MPRCNRCSIGLMVQATDPLAHIDSYLTCLSCGHEDYGQAPGETPELRSTKHNAGPTERSKAIRRMIAKGWPHADIAAAFGLSLGAIQHHASAVRLDAMEAT